MGLKQQQVGKSFEKGIGRLNFLPNSMVQFAT